MDLAGLHWGAVSFDRRYILYTGHLNFVVYIDCCVSKVMLDKLRESGGKMGGSDILQPNINNVTHFKAFSQ